MKDIVIVDGVRTGIGAFNGSLMDFEVTDLGAMVIEEGAETRWRGQGKRR